MKDGPAFQMYADLFFIDTAEWDPYEVGIYLRMLLCQWANGSISSDKKVLEKVTGSTPKKFQKASKNVFDKFILGDDGRFRNLKLEEVRLKQRQYREKQRQNAIIGAKKRWNKNVATATANGIAMAEPSLKPEHMPNDASSSLSSTSLKELKDLKHIEHPVKDAPNPDVKIFIDFYFEEFKKRFGINPLIDGGKDGKIVKRLLTVTFLADLKETLLKFFISDDDFIKKSGYTIGAFKSQINKLRVGGGKQDGIDKATQRLKEAINKQEQKQISYDS